MVSGLTVNPIPQRDRRPIFTAAELPGLATAVTLLASTSIAVILLGAVAGQMQPALGFDDRALGLGVALFWAVSALCAPWGGRLADRYGWVRTARFSAALSALPLLGIGVATRGYLQLTALLVLGGLAHGLGSPTGNVALSAIRRRRRGLAFGMKQASVPLVSILAGIAVPVVALTVGWRWAFLLALPLPALVLLATRRHGTHPPHPGAAVAQHPPSVITTPPPPGIRPAAQSARRALWVETASAALGTLSSGAMATFTVRTLTESGFSPGTAGLLFAVAGAGSLAMRLAAGWWADRRAVDTTRQVVVFLLVGAVGMVLLATGVAPLVAVGSFLALVWGWSWVALFLVSAVSRDVAAAGATTGTLQLGLAGGAAGGPLLFGLVVGAAGFSVAWAVIAACSALSAVLLVRAQRRRPAPPETAQPPPLSPGAAAAPDPAAHLRTDPRT